MLDLAAVVRIAPEFSPAEQDRARAAAARDRRLAVALEAAGYGLTQTLAAAPQLVARWAGRPDRWPVRVGGADRGAGCGPARRPRAAERRLAARRRAGLLHQPAAGRGAGQLVRAGSGLRHRQAARRRRRPQPRRGRHGPGRRVHRRGLPDPARQPGTPPRPRACQYLGRPPQPRPRPRRRRPARRQRQDRLLYCYAIPLYRHAAEAGDGDAAGSWPCCWPSAATWTSCAPGPTPATRPAAWRAGELLAGRGRPGPGSQSCAPGPTRRRDAAVRLAELLARRGDLDGLRARADAGDETPPCGWPSCWPSAATWTAAGTARPGRRRRQTPPGSWPSCWPSAATWTRPQILRARADAGDKRAAWQLAGCWPSAATWTSCAPGPTPATERRRGLARLLAERGDLDGLRARADAGDKAAAIGWPICWPSAATWRGCAPGPTPATGRRRAAGRPADQAGPG